jgi:hypothetical protein
MTKPAYIDRFDYGKDGVKYMEPPGYIIGADRYVPKTTGGSMIHGEYRDLKELEAMMHIHSESPGGVYALALSMLAVAQALQDQCAATRMVGQQLEELSSEIYLRFPKVSA